jgi:hypothetical protein
MNLNSHLRIGRYIFWIAQIIGVTTVTILILFVGGNVIGELIGKELDVREDYMLFIFFVLEVLTGISFIISWKRKRRGPALILFFTVLVCILWGRENLNVLWFHSPILLSGLILLFYSFYKEWILKKKP